MVSSLVYSKFLALQKAQVSLQLGKIFSSDDKVSVYIMYSYKYWLLYTAKREKLISHNVYVSAL